MLNRVFTLAAMSIVLLGCSGGESTGTVIKNKVGADRDEHGCIASAGYAWCARTDSCERPWELAKKEGFENTPERFSDYCSE